MKLKGIEIKPGMVIITKNARYVAFPTGMSDYPIAFANITVGEWTYNITETLVEKIYDLITDWGLDSDELKAPCGLLNRRGKRLVTKIKYCDYKDL